MIRDPRPQNTDDERLPEIPGDEPLSESSGDELDLDLEEVGDSDRLKEGFTGQER